ncbi:MAG TPA: hypothetical protein VN612_06390, partial [Acidobacteriaceae bacterium]|nr:hypothetical protein [Acidobacteriaceae bacterium]
LQNRPTLRRSKTLPATHTPVKEKALLCTPLKEKKTLATQERIFGNDKTKDSSLVREMNPNQSNPKPNHHACKFKTM